MAGDENELRELIAAGEKVGAWLAAALDDPAVCVEMKQDADRFLHALDPYLGGLFAAAPAHEDGREDARDAARYRWLKTHLPPGTFGDFDVFDPASWDAAIDADIVQAEREGE